MYCTWRKVIECPSILLSFIRGWLIFDENYESDLPQPWQKLTASSHQLTATWGKFLLELAVSTCGKSHITYLKYLPQLAVSTYRKYTFTYRNLQDETHDSIFLRYIENPHTHNIYMYVLLPLANGRLHEARSDANTEHQVTSADRLPPYVHLCFRVFR